MLVAFDCGNAGGKYLAPKSGQYNYFIHALAQLTEAEWAAVRGRGKPPQGIVKVNGIPYAIGDAARRYSIAERPKGAARYIQTYYGVLAAYAISESLPPALNTRHVEPITLYASHAPADIAYTRHLRDAARGQWQVDSWRGKLLFDVRKVATFDEPLGGFSHFAFTETGEEKRNNPLRHKTTLVVDVGGHTVDTAAIDPGGSIDVLSLKSTRTGVLKLMQDFENELRRNNRTLFQNALDLDPRRVETALLTGEYPFGKTGVKCASESEQAIQTLTNDVVSIIHAAGGAANFDVVLLTGGGAALICDSLIQAMPRMEFLLAERDRRLMRFANVFGGAKIAALLRKVH